MDNTKAVLPIPGRAAIIISSEFCHPLVISSISVNPDGIPLKPLGRFPILSISLSHFE